ncbi:MAG: hypothetical protein KatS3mg102_2206 [Planctomycetota bacterium]|nr:MAG: hypothetical protein KatS3mg102_2206 [Planctomycetota bacterium]
MATRIAHLAQQWGNRGWRMAGGRSFVELRLDASRPAMAWALALLPEGLVPAEPAPLAADTPAAELQAALARDLQALRHIEQAALRFEPGAGELAVELRTPTQ